jgi:ubiquinone/menaquinone biosynthesis C-methylase UbiE
LPWPRPISAKIVVVSEMWNSVASGWEANAEFVDGHLAAATDILLDATRITEGDAVLEVAAGPGGAGLHAAERVGPGGSVTLSDDAPEMVAIAARRATGYPQVGTAVFDQSDIVAEDGRFDAVISRHGLMFAEDPVGAVKEAVRVLRPGGGFGAITWGPRDKNPWLGLVLDAVGEQFGVPFPPPNVPGPFSLGDAGVLNSVLKEGGLEGVEVKALETPMHAASVQAWWERVPQLAGPLATALAAMEPEVREQIAQRALDAGTEASRADGDGVVLSGSVLIASGQAPRH